MKKTLLAIVFLTSGTAFASVGAEATYNALNVQEQTLLNTRTLRKYQKSISNLVCIKTSSILIGDSYSCSLSLSQVDNVAIYSSLNVRETTIPAVRTELKFQKSVGALICEKTSHVVNGDSFDCSIAL